MILGIRLTKLNQTHLDFERNVFLYTTFILCRNIKYIEYYTRSNLILSSSCTDLCSSNTKSRVITSAWWVVVACSTWVSLRQYHNVPMQGQSANQTIPAYLIYIRVKHVLFFLYGQLYGCNNVIHSSDIMIITQDIFSPDFLDILKHLIKNSKNS